MTLFYSIITLVNIFAIALMIFRERKKPESIISWLLLFSFFPIIGFLFYVLIGGGLSVKTKNMLKRKQLYNEKYTNYFINNIEAPRKINQNALSIINFNTQNANAVPTYGNKVKVFTDGNKKIDSLTKDILSAKHSVNLEYYIFGDDNAGQKVMNALIQKAKEGVKVNLIFDSVGSMRSPRRFFKTLKKAGGKVKEFFPPLFNIRLINLKMNYRNHRKIAVIDGKIGYVGGINIRDDHCGGNPKVAPWCDAHIRVEGQAVYTLQNEFLNFWQFCNKENTETNKWVEAGYFPAITPKGETIMQTVSSGPDMKDYKIRDAMVKMINLAEKEIILQTPYFVPDEVFLTAIKTAIRSGVNFKLIIPGKPDKKMVYAATQSFANEVLQAGGEVYLYQGFIHAKALVVDDFAMTIGSANADNRSFALNFEINAIMYDSYLVAEYKNIINLILDTSKQLDKNYYKNKSAWTKFKQLFFRLFSPLF